VQRIAGALGQVEEKGGGLLCTLAVGVHEVVGLNLQGLGNVVVEQRFARFQELLLGFDPRQPQQSLGKVFSVCTPRICHNFTSSRSSGLPLAC